MQMMNIQGVDEKLQFIIGLQNASVYHKHERPLTLQ